MSISKEVRVQVFKRDGWVCQWCERPVIFAPAMRCLEGLVRQRGFSGPLAYHHSNWSAHHAPLLDQLGAEIDHVKAGGGDDPNNLATSCHKCNTRKSNADKEDFAKKWPVIPVKRKYGKPVDWDGFSALFAVLVEQSPKPATQEERGWLKALKKSLAGA
jgi:HNH endonuclease